MGLVDDLERAAGAARAYAGPGEELAAVIPAEPDGAVVFLCAFESAGGRSWLALDGRTAPVTDRRLVRDAATIAALCELAEETAGGGDLDALELRVGELREAEGPDLVGPEADRALQQARAALDEGPRVASPAYLDGIGAAARELERALGALTGSPFAEAMKQGSGAIETLVAEVEAGYRLPLS